LIRREGLFVRREGFFLRREVLFLRREGFFTSSNLHPEGSGASADMHGELQRFPVALVLGVGIQNTIKMGYELRACVHESTNSPG
jgi:hypothetical protein